MIGIVDYGMGNLKSVFKAVEKVGAKPVFVREKKDLERVKKLILPGVGAFKDCVSNLKDMELFEPIRDVILEGVPFLGICLGMQILFEESYEFGKHSGMGIFKGVVKNFREDNPFIKVPHMGWNTVQIKKDSPIFSKIPNNSFFYFVHSYYVLPKEDEIVISSTDYGIEFTSGISKNSIYGFQFHPEKSQKVGLTLLKNFVDL